MTYLDTSALIKRFVAEKGSAVVKALVSRGDPVATAKIAYAEVYAGLTRKKREGHLSARDYDLACGQFETEWQAYIRVDLDDGVLRRARDLIRSMPLRGFDAVHLASAVLLATTLAEEITFAAADERLLRAAAAAKLIPLDVEKVPAP